MTEDKKGQPKRLRRAAGGRRIEHRKQPPQSEIRNPQSAISSVLLALFLCILALRATYTESPTAQTTGLAGSLTDTVYSLTLSGLLIFALVAWLVWAALSGRVTYRFTGMEIGLALFLVACVVATAAASDKRLALSQTMILLGPLLAAVLLVQILDSGLKIRLALIVVGALAIVSAYQSAEQFLVSNEITIEQYEQAPETLLGPLGIEPGSFQQFLFEHRLYSRGIRGFFTTSNSAASFALMAALAALALLGEQARPAGPDRSRSKALLCRAVATLMIVAGLALTQSKGGILGFLAAAVLFAVLLAAGKWLAAHRNSVRTVLLPLAVVVVVAVGYAAISYGLKHGRLPGGNSMLVRWQYWVASVQMFLDHPLAGVGPGNFAEAYMQYKPAAAPESVADPHNLPLSLLTQYGPLGLVGFLAMVFVPLWRHMRLAAADNVSPQQHEAPAPKRFVLTMLGVVCASLLVLRPVLIPMSPGGDATVVLYEVVALYVAPAAAFLIGFLLLATPLLGPSAQPPRAAGATIQAALGGAVFGVLVHNLIDFAIFEPGVWATFWLLLACFVAVRFDESGQPSKRANVSVRVKVLAVATALALLALYQQCVWKPVYEATTRIRRAQRAAIMGWYDQAHRLLDAAAEADPLSPAALSLSGRLYLQEYEAGSAAQPALLENAAQCFRTAIAISPADYKDYERLGQAYTRLGQNRQAYEWHSRAVERYPGSGRLWLQRARAAERIDQPEAALAAYCRAVEIEDAYRQQFRHMYPQRELVSRLGEENYQLARERMAELSQ